MNKSFSLGILALFFCSSFSFAQTTRNYAGYQGTGNTRYTTTTYSQPANYNTTYNRPNSASYVPVTETSNYIYSDRSITAGSSIAYIQGGLAIPNGGKDLYSPTNEFEGKKMRYADIGGRFDVSYTYFVNPYFGIGGEIGGTWFSEEKNQRFYPGYNQQIKEGFSMDLFNLHLTGRLNINPYDPVRLYIPFGGGLTVARGTYTYEYRDYWMPGWTEPYENDGTTYSMGWFAGLGIEIESSPNLVWGAEVRYSNFAFDKDEYGWEHQGISGYDRYGYLSILFKVGVRF